MLCCVNSIFVSGGGGGSANQSWAGCLLLVLSVFRSAHLNGVSSFN